MEGDNGGDFQRIVKPTFQSTPSAWRVTGFALLGFQQIVISIHTLRVEGDSYYNYLRDVLDHISIHTLRVEGDERDPSWRQQLDISIHTLRVEGDCRCWRFRIYRTISIHTLRVEGDVWWDLFKMVFVLFQSTPSAWRVTDNLNQVFQPFSISIHTLRVEGDSSRSALIAGSKQISIHTLRVEGDHGH